jgi:hypothetical protein
MGKTDTQGRMPKLLDEVERYEAWLAKRCKVVKKDLAFKHERMRQSAFHFLRGSYFRWAGVIETVCPGVVHAPKVLSAGDIHVENFGTWRDADARHVWGVNDFDEAAVMPYPFDLIRLVASADLAPSLATGPQAAAQAVLKGYVDGLGSPRPLLIDQGAGWFSALASHLNDNVESFWEDALGCEPARPPPRVEQLLRNSLPRGARVQRLGTWRKGGGSLGRPRYVLIANWQGGFVVREAKAMVPSAWDWAHAKAERMPRFLELAFGRCRSPDPSLALAHGFVIRRVAPDARKLDLEDVAAQGLTAVLLEAMGREIGAIHATHRRAERVIDDLGRRGGAWLHVAARAAVEAVQVDFETWDKLQRQAHRARK